jgi:radial spoke head protein 1
MHRSARPGSISGLIAEAAGAQPQPDPIVSSAPKPARIRKAAAPKSDDIASTAPNAVEENAQPLDVSEDVAENMTDVAGAEGTEGATAEEPAAETAAAEPAEAPSEPETAAEGTAEAATPKRSLFGGLTTPTNK